MTEDEARQKWCPFVRVTVALNDSQWQGGTLTNRGEWTNGDPPTHCIGSACAVWHWRRYPSEKAGESKPGEGYCGLTP